jgi:hypothetical protein
MKTCSKCKIEKDYKEFYKQSCNSKDGYQSHCKICDNERKKNWNKNNAEKAKKYSAQSELNRRNNEKRIQYRKDLKKLPHIKASNNALHAKRRAAKLNRTPMWLTEHDKFLIKVYYKIAQMLTKVNKEEWHVDHNIPLQATLASGLHVPSNLRLMRGIDNETKRNFYEIT